MCRPARLAAILAAASLPAASVRASPARPPGHDAQQQDQHDDLRRPQRGNGRRRSVVVDDRADTQRIGAPAGVKVRVPDVAT